MSEPIISFEPKVHSEPKISFNDITDLWDKKPYSGHVAGYKMNCYGIGAIAYDPEQVIRKKVFKDVVFEPNWYIRVGTSIHAFIQSQMNNEWNHEQEIWIDIPFQWNSIKEDRIVLYGSIDSINFEKGIICEYKTSFGTDGTISDYMIYQLAAYAYLAKTMYHRDFEAHIIKISLKENNPVIDRVLTDEEKENGWQVVLGRAKETAQKIDALLAERAIEKHGRK